MLMGMILLGLVTVLVTHVLASDVVFLALHRGLGSVWRPRPMTLFVLTRGVGPIVTAWLLYNLFLFTPGLPRVYYVVSVVAVFTAIGLLCRSGLPILLGVYRKLAADSRRLGGLRPMTAALLLLVSAIYIFALAVGVGLPIVGHDSLILAMDARLMLRDLSLEGYLQGTTADPATGYITPSFQTPFLPLLYVWYGLLAGSESMDLLARTTSPLYGLYCLMILAWAIYRRRPESIDSGNDAVWASLLLVSTPLFFLMTYDNAQDTPRYYFTFLALIWLSRPLSASGPGVARLWVAVGVYSGFAILSHLLGAPALVAGMLVFLVLSEIPWRSRLIGAATITLVATLAGGTYHYSQSETVQRKLASNFSWGFVTEWAQLLQVRSSDQIEPFEVASTETAPGVAGVADDSPPTRDSVEPIPPKSSALDEAQGRDFGGLVTSRGQGQTPLAQFLFGRLQMFTGVESFGLLFWFFGAVFIAAWRRREGWSSLDKVLLGAFAVYCVVVLSGVRTVSWSNPRYIGTLMIVAAYFVGPKLAAWVRRGIARWPRLRVPLLSGVLCAVVFPVVLVTGVRGAKLGITNTGSFYSNVRSFRWLSSLRERPVPAVLTFWRDYVGARRTFAYFFSGQEEQLRHAHDYFAAIQYLNEVSPPESKALVFRDGRYFYYSQRKGVAFLRGPMSDVPRKKGPEEVHVFLDSLGIDYILLDSFIEAGPQYHIDDLAPMLRDPQLSELVFVYESAKVYRLRDRQSLFAKTDSKRATSETRAVPPSNQPPVDAVVPR